MTEPIDNDARKRAVSEQEKNIVVTAGAGTGKTTLLVNRMLHTILGHTRFHGEESPICRIVAMTFTEKAASDMKVRLMEELEKIVAAINDNAPPGEKEKVEKFLAHIRDTYQTTYRDIERRARKSLEDMDKAPIGTIHSFAAYLLRLYPIESGVAPGFTVDEGDAFDELFDKEWARWLTTELALDAPQATAWKETLRRLDLESLKGLAKRLSGFSVPLDSLTATFNTEVGLKKGEESSPLKVSLHALAAPLLNEIQRIIPLCDKPKNNLLSQVHELSKILDVLQREGIASLDNTEYDLDKNPSTAKAGWTEEGFEAAQKLVKECHGLLKKLKTVDEALIKTVISLVSAFVKDFRQTYLSRGYVSFDGLLTLTRDLLQNSEYRYIRDKLKNEFRAILVDEFQDTDPVQYEIVLFLSESLEHYSNDARKVVLEPGKLFIVGDPKQSIYAFRRADIEAYEYVVRQVCEEDGVLKLQENFRSHSGIIDTINRLFDGRIMVERHGLQPRYIPIHANRPKKLASQGVEAVFVSGKEGEGLKAGEAREAEAEWIARWITGHVNTEAIEDKQAAGGSRTLRYKDVALLLRAFTQVRPYIEALKRYHIPYLVEGEKYFYTTQEIFDLINILRAIENPHDTIALVGALRSPLVGLTDREIYELKARNLLDYRRDVAANTCLPRSGVKDFTERIPKSPLNQGKPEDGIQNGLSPDCIESVTWFYHFMRKMNARAGTLPISRLIAGIIGDTSMAEITARAWHGEQKLANVWKLHQMACDMEEAEDVSLKTFLDRIKARIQEAREEGESPLSDETLDVVKVLTIHKSKGLEFPVVILGNLHGEVRNAGETLDTAVFDWSSDTTGVVIGKGRRQARNLHSILIERKLNERSWEEEKRVLYVAMTRAKERLILTGALKDDDKSYMGLITQSMEGITGGELRSTLSLGNVEMTIERFMYDGARYPAGNQQDKTLDADFTSLAGIWKKRESAMAETARSRLFTSPTAGSGEEPAGFGVSSVPEKEYEAGDVPAGHAATVGSICHLALEGWDFSGTREELSRSVESAAEWFFSNEGRGVFKISQDALQPQTAGDVKAVIKEEVAKVLAGFIGTEAYRELQHARILGREVPILLNWDGQIMRGVIDVIYKIGDRTVIADYKTDRVVPAGLDERAAKYRRQKEVYTEAAKCCLNVESPEFKLIFLRLGKAVTL